MAVATYGYCIVRTPRKPSLRGMPRGVPKAARPDALRVTSTLWLIAAQVPLDRYGERALEEVLSDIDAVGQIALAHEAVVEHFSRRRTATVVPLKLFTMFSSPERAAAEVRAGRKAIQAAMRRIAGAEEWGVRVLRGPTVPHVRAAAVRPRSGRAFLEGRRDARQAARAAAATAEGSAADAFARLARLSRASVRRDDAPAAAAPPLLDAAFLVPVAGRARFTAAARREAAACARAGARMTLTGPWPAYNFVLPREEAG